jgi:two-component system, cell cycle sensor histidine kinase and response regulator CckA
MNPAPQDEKTVQEALRNSEVRYRRLFETAQDGILILDAGTGQITDANPFLLDMLGYIRGELLGKQLWEIGLFRDRALAEAAFEKLQKEGYIRYEDLPLETKDGQRHEVEFVSNSYEVDHQKVIQCNIRDITDRKLLETKLQQARKMETVGQLAGGVAHDYNNLLTSTLLQLSLLLEKPNLPEDIKTSLSQLEHEAKRAAGLTRQLLLFSRQQVIQLRPLNLNEVLNDLVKMLRRLLSKDVSLEFQAGDDPLWIEADTTMIEQVVTNLCLNAQDAMTSQGGRLTIAAKLVELDAAAPRVDPEARPGLFVCLSVTDTGSGMDAATLKRIFEPFFTTKEVGKGTGLGLSTVYGITKQHRGWLEVDSELGKGSTFRVYLPSLTQAPSVAAEPPALRVQRGKEAILLVDDDQAIRDMVALGLQLYGYRVLEAADGEEALRVWADHAGEIDLLFTDMRMPGGMSGMELFERLKQAKTTLKGIVSSGYSDEILEAQEVLSPGVTFLPKPYDVKALVSTVRSCLDQA